MWGQAWEGGVPCGAMRGVRTGGRDAREAAEGDLRRYNRFSEQTGFPIFLGEYAIDGTVASVNLTQLARWYTSEASRVGVGAAIWNYDGPGNWGAVVPTSRQKRLDWKQVWTW